MSNGISPRYVSMGKLLSGGMGKVLVCRDNNLEREVAIKFIKHHGKQQRIFDEIAALQKIRSKHVVQIFDVLIDNDNLSIEDNFQVEFNTRIGIVQEFIPGEDLVSFCQNKNFSLDEYLKILFQISSGISNIHAQGLIHRDIKPNNMKFNQTNILKIFDFGLSRFANKNDSTLGFQGTHRFAAPELYQSGSVSFTNAIDTYAFGVTAWYLVAKDIPEELSKIPPEFDHIPSFTSLPLSIPAPILNLLDRTLAKDLTCRPSMSEIKDSIGNYLLYGKHRGLIIAGNNEYVLERVNQNVSINVPGYGLLDIKYDGLNFLINNINGAVYVNNQSVNKGYILPKDCVITLGDSSRGAARRFITFDVSNPEVVL